MRSKWLLLFLCPVLLWPQGRTAAPAPPPITSSRDRQLEQDQRNAQNGEVLHDARHKTEEQQRAAAESLKALQDDVDRLTKLSQELKGALTATNPDLLSEDSLKRNDEMEKLVKKIKSTMKKAAR